MTCHTGNFSLFENCLNELTGEIIRFPCQPVICEDSSSNPSEDKFPVWAQAMTATLIVVVLLVFVIFLLKKMATHTCTAVFGFILGGSMVPHPKNVDLEAANFEEDNARDQKSSEPEPSAPPSYNEAIQNYSHV